MWFAFGTANLGDELIAINRRLDILMALVSIEQADLDDVASTVSTVADELQAIIDNPNPLAPADETALRAAVEKLQGVGPKVADSTAGQQPAGAGGLSGDVSVPPTGGQVDPGIDPTDVNPAGPNVSSSPGTAQPEGGHLGAV